MRVIGIKLNYKFRKEKVRMRQSDDLIKAQGSTQKGGKN